MTAVGKPLWLFHAWICCHLYSLIAVLLSLVSAMCMRVSAETDKGNGTQERQHCPCEEWSTFIRQLNAYSFTRQSPLCVGRRVVYAHASFTRTSMPEQIATIPRRRPVSSPPSPEKCADDSS